MANCKSCRVFLEEHTVVVADHQPVLICSLLGPDSVQNADEKCNKTNRDLIADATCNQLSSYCRKFY